MENKFDISKYVEFVGRKLVSEFEDARELGVDPNAKGFAIESATRKRLASLLPSVLDVGQGYIIDSYGNTSKQIDLVIFERSLCPVFSINGSPESTYYPCEGVVAAIEIKSKAGKKEFIDSCAKADSVRKLNRRFKTTENGEYINPRRYGQVELIPEASKRHTVDPSLSIACDIFTGLIAGELTVKQETFREYFDEAQGNSPDALFSLDGICMNFTSSSNLLSNARLGKSIEMGKLKRPFSLFIAILYSRLYYGGTSPIESFLNYVSDAAIFEIDE